jgi:hypothetical protein
LPIVGWDIASVGEAHYTAGVVRATLIRGDGRCCRYEAWADENLVELRLDYERASVRAIGSDMRSKCLELALASEDFQPLDICDADDPDPRERFLQGSFYRSVTQGGRVADDGREHLQALAVVDALQRAADTGQAAIVINP